MSVYRRNATRCQRWLPDEGVWVDCARDEPETRYRKPTEGMILVPADAFADDGPPVIPIDRLLAALKKGDTPPE